MIVNRYDTIDINKMATKFVKTDEGFLKGRAVVARTGVYKYMKADGTYDLNIVPMKKYLIMMPLKL